MKATRLLSFVLLTGAAAVAVSCGDRSPLGITPSGPRPRAGLLDTLVQTVNQAASLLTCSPLAAASATQTIGAAGGTIQVGPHTLTIPAGALSDTVTITAVAPSDTVSRVQFQPQGLQFQQPASLTLSYANCNATSQAKQIAYTNDALQILELVASQDSAAAQTVTGQISHFSDYAVAW
jgi:hypothetical protein